MRHPSLWLALWLVGCWSAKDNALFTRSDASTGGALTTGAAGSVAAVSGTGSSSAGNGQAGSDIGGAPPAGGSSSGGASAGSSNPGGASGAGAGGSAGQQPSAPIVQSCDMVEDSVVRPESGHCYRVATDELSFTAASDACQAAGGHLVTISDEQEEAFVGDLHGEAHWLGATDGRDERMAGVGTYVWVDDEPWDYEHWEDGQPNAHAIDCPNEDGGAHCYEHCGYQTGDGVWIDRACWDTIASICEWDLPADGAGVGQGGSP
jgi:hypothetical protein